MYLLVKQLHVACVLLSLAGFVVRGALMAARAPLARSRRVRVAPHVVDTALLGSAIWPAWGSHQYPFVHGWLTAKVLGLLAYIGFGTMALKHGRTLRVRLVFFFVALVAVPYIVAVALTRDPGAPLNWLRWS